MEQQREDELRGRRAGRPPIRLPLHTSSFRRSRSRSPSGHDDDDHDNVNGHALRRPAGEGRDSGDEPSLVRETAPARAEEPTALSRPQWNAAPMERGLRRPPPPRDGDHYRPSPPRDDVLDDIKPTIDHINARRIHYRNKAAISALESKAITVETLAAQAWMDAYLEIQRRQAQQMVNGSSPPDEVKLAKYRNALTAAKRALTEINETSDDASARAASALAEISKALEGEAL